MTGTPFCMLPVTSINNLPINNKNIGNVFKNLLDQWSSNVGINISSQIKNWNSEMNQLSDSPTPYTFKKK